MMTDSATGIKYTSYTQPTVRFVSLSQHDIICTSQYSMMSPNAIIGEEDNWVEETSGEWSVILYVQSTKPPKTGIIKSKRPERKEKKMARYSKEFKSEALKLSDELGVKKAAAQLGIPYYTLADWRNNRKHAEPEPELSEVELKIRNRELERENAELRVANEILKDALGFFAKDRKK